MGDDGTGDTGGNDGSTSGNGWNDENSGTLWGWLSSVVGGLESIWETITNLPQLIYEKLVGLFNDIKDAIVGLPQRTLDGLKAIFIPNTEHIQSSFDSFLAELKMKFGFSTDFFDGLYDSERPVTDVFEDYEILGVGTFNLKFFDTKFFYEGVSYFRPFIRGFIVLLMAFYHIKMLLGFFRQDAGVVTGKVVEMSNKEK